MNYSHIRYQAVVNIWKIIAARLAVICLAASILAAAISYIPKPTPEVVVAEPETVMQPHVTAKFRPVQQKPVLDPPEMTAEDEDELLQVMMAEGESESIASKALIGLAWINRRESPDFPNSIYECLMQPKQCTPIWDGRYYTVTPDEDCYVALELVESGWNPYPDLKWYESCEEPSQWHKENLTYLFSLGDMRFYGTKEDQV